MDAFATGVEHGARVLELDVHATRDGTVVVLHDETVDRTTTGSGAVRHLELEEVRSFDAGHHFRDTAGEHSFRGRDLRIPTLREVAEAFPDTALNIEIKQHAPDIVEDVIEVLEGAAALERTLLAAADVRIMKRIREAAPDVTTSFAGREVMAFVARVTSRILRGYRPPAPVLQVPTQHRGIPIVTRRFVEAAHALGLEVHVWTINDEKEMVRLLELGVDGIVTDDVATAVKVIGR